MYVRGAVWFTCSRRRAVQEYGAAKEVEEKSPREAENAPQGQAALKRPAKEKRGPGAATKRQAKIKLLRAK